MVRMLINTYCNAMYFAAEIYFVFILFYYYLLFKVDFTYKHSTMRPTGQGESTHLGDLLLS